MSRFLIAGTLLFVPLGASPAWAQSALPSAMADDGAAPAMARLFPTAPVARRIDPIVPAIKRSQPGALSSLTTKAVSRLTTLVVPKPVRAVRPVSADTVVKSNQPVLLVPPQEVVRAPATPAAVAAAVPTAVNGAVATLPVAVTNVARPVAVTPTHRSTAMTSMVAVYTCKWGQDFSIKFNRCVNSKSALAAPPKGVVVAKASKAKSGVAVVAAQTPAVSATGKAGARSGVTVANTPLAPGAIAGALMAKQAETGIVGAISAARTKATTTKTVGSKPALDPNSRMSLGATKK